MSTIRYICVGVVRVFLSFAIIATGVFLTFKALQSDDLAGDVAAVFRAAGSALEAQNLKKPEASDAARIEIRASNTAPTQPVSPLNPPEQASGYVSAQAVLDALVTVQTRAQALQLQTQDKLLGELTYQQNRAQVLEGALQMREFRDQRLIVDLEKLGGALAEATVPTLPIKSGMARLLGELETALSEQGINVESDADAGILRIAESSLGFERGRSDILPPAQEVLTKIASVLSAVLPRYTSCRLSSGSRVCSGQLGPAIETMFIEGHTDQTGSVERNWFLSTERAINTYRVLTEAEPELGTLLNEKERPVLSVAAYAGTRPIDFTPSDLGRARNRRIELRFVMEPNNTADTHDAEQTLADFLNVLNELSKPMEYLQLEAITRTNMRTDTSF